MKITAIKQQVRRKDRYSIYVDEKYSFSLSETALLEAKLANGQELDDIAVEDYKRLSAEDKIYGNALRYSAIRLRSRWEMESYLQRKEAAPELADSILNKLSNYGFINDLLFAKAWVENRHLLRPTSKRKLQQELRAKRVSSEIIDQVLGDDDTDDQHELRAMIDRKRKQSKYQDQTKLMQYLARQGFGYEDIKTALASARSSDAQDG